MLPVTLFTQQSEIVQVPVSCVQLIGSLTSNKVKYKNLAAYTFLLCSHRKVTLVDIGRDLREKKKIPDERKISVRKCK